MKECEAPECENIPYHTEEYCDDCLDQMAVKWERQAEGD